MSLTQILVGTSFMGRQEAIKIKHQETGLECSCYIGYSWTYFLFGIFVPACRGENKIALTHLILSVLTLGLFQFALMPFLYNKQHGMRLLTSGWSLSDVEERNNLVRDLYFG